VLPMHQGRITLKCRCTNLSMTDLTQVRILKDLISILETCLPMELKKHMNNQANNRMTKVRGEGRRREVATAHHKVVNQANVDQEIETDHQVVVVLTIIEMTNNNETRGHQHHPKKINLTKMNTMEDMGRTSMDMT